MPRWGCRRGLCLCGTTHVLYLSETKLSDHKHCLCLSWTTNIVCASAGPHCASVGPQTLFVPQLDHKHCLRLTGTRHTVFAPVRTDMVCESTGPTDFFFFFFFFFFRGGGGFDQTWSVPQLDQTWHVPQCDQTWHVPQCDQTWHVPE